VPVTVDDVFAARDRLRGSVATTPAVRAGALSEVTGVDLVVKLENLQHTGSFKERGACNRLSLLSQAERAQGVLAISAGNHALAVARHAQRLGLHSTVVMPAGTPWAKVVPVGRLGSEVVLHGDTFDEAQEHGLRLATRTGQVVIPPFDDPAVVAGQGTVGLELLESHPDLDVLVVPVGGGGLLAGVAVVARALRPGIELVGVQSDHFATLVHPPRPRVVDGTTLAEGIAVKVPGGLTSSIIDALVDDVVSVSDERIEEAIGLFLEVGKVSAEGAGAAALASVLDDPERFRGRAVGVVLSGANIDAHLLAQVIMRQLTRSGRLLSLVLELPDRPGTLAAVAALVARLGGNIISVSHDRHQPGLASRAAVLELTVEIRDPDHGRQLLDALRAAGYSPTTSAPPDPPG
jgi:threonine dehydratase